MSTTAPIPLRTAAAPAVRGAGWLATGAVTAKTCQTLVLLVFAAVLDPSSFGVISLAAAALNIATVLADLGAGTALVHLRGDAERAARTAVTLGLAVSAALVVVVWCAAPVLSGLVQAGDLGVEVLRGIVLCTPLAALSVVSGELLRRALDFRRRVLPDIAGNVVGALVTVASLAAGHGAMALVHGQLVQAVVVLALFWVLRRPVLPGWSGPDARDLLAFGGSLAASGLLTLVVLNVDYLLVAHRLGTADVGVYSMAFRIAYMPYLLIAMVVGGAVFAHLCRLRGAAVGEAVSDAALRLHLLVVPLYTGMIVLAPQLRLLGEQWAPAVPALRWLAAYGLVLSALELVVVALKSVGRTPVVLGLTAFHLLALVGLLLPALRWGVTGVALAQLVAGLLTLAVALLLAPRYVDGLVGSGLLRRSVPVAAGGAALAVTALVSRALLPWGPVSVPGLLVAGTLSVLAYAATVRLLERAGLPGRALLLGVVTILAATVAGTAAVLAPAPALLGAAALVVLGVAVRRIEWAAIGYVAVEPFGDLLRALHPAAVKVAGAVLFLAWLVRLAQDPRVAGMRQGGMRALAALMTVLLASFVVHGADLGTGADHLLSYVSYALVVVVLVDTARRARPDTITFATRLATSYLLACTAAGLVAIGDFLAHGGRGAGPLEDPNDLAFFLLVALPFAPLLARRAPAGAAACALVLLVAITVTFSRGALVGLAVMVGVALYLGALRATTVVAAGLVAVSAVGVLWAANAALVSESLAEKDHIAAENVDLRLTTWTMAAEMTVDSPLLGQGPGGFQAQTARYVPAGVTEVRQTVVHQMYLDVSAELGLLGLAAFGAVLAHGVHGAARARSLARSRPLADAVLVAFAGALVAACFLSEQLYLPVWLLVALGLALNPHPRSS
ncbi:oligosaccharide flippase family protein [Nocardioides sp. LML1-1-1.1]|uniref:oligosaccharide flippase family protein n=1 Tax=Nocardioides sp. LML1-1-1.1 TaxID=3135248 RepID=UPI0034492CF2